MTAMGQTNRNERQTCLLSINNYYYRRGGAEAVFFDHNRLFSDIGWQVIPFAMQHPDNESSQWSDYFVKELEYGRKSSPLTKLVQAGKVIYSFEARNRLAELLDRAEPALAHAHNVYHHLSPSIFPLLKKRNVPTLMTVHDLKLACPAYKMLRANIVCEKCKSGHLHHVLANRCVKDSLTLSSLVYLESEVHRALGLYRKFIDGLIVPSRFYLEKLVEWGWPREKMHYVANALDIKAMKQDWEEGDYFLFAGRLAPEKGVETLIKAAAQSGQIVKIAGTGPEEENLKKLALACNAPVQFVGYVSGEPLARLIGEAKALALPSQWYENAPISVLEAYGYRTPVLGANIGGIPEMIEQGETGYRVESGDVGQWAEAMNAFSALPSARRADMGRAGRDFAIKHFSRQLYQEKMLEIYASLGVKNEQT